MPKCTHYKSNIPDRSNHEYFENSAVTTWQIQLTIEAIVNVNKVIYFLSHCCLKFSLQKKLEVNRLSEDCPIKLQITLTDL